MDTDHTRTKVAPADGRRRWSGWLQAPGPLASRLIAGAVVLAIAIVAAGRVGGLDIQPLGADPEVPADLQDAVAQVFATGQCVTATAADEATRARLIGLGYREWQIERGPGVSPDRCVSSIIDAIGQRVVLIQALRPEVREALHEVSEELLDRCLGEKEARKRIASVLATLGETGWEIRSGGPVGGPLDRLDEIRRHVDAGCFVYSATGWTADGVRLYYIAGR